MKPLEVTYTVRRSDLAWMYLGSWAARFCLGPGIVSMLIGIPTNPKFPLSDYLVFIVFGVFLLAATPLLLLVMLWGRYGANEVIGQTVKLTISGHGVTGWPPARGMDTRWVRIRRIHRMRGVITLPFSNRGTRAAWTPIPERALSAEQLAALRELMREKGVM